MTSCLKIECGQLHSELFGRSRSTLQSHGLFALAKPLYITVHGVGLLATAYV